MFSVVLHALLLTLATDVYVVDLGMKALCDFPQRRRAMTDSVLVTSESVSRDLAVD